MSENIGQVENGLCLLKQEMENEEVHIKVNAVHRMSIVIHSIGQSDTLNDLVPYIYELIKCQDDEVLFAVAEELGKCFEFIDDKTAFLSLLEALAAHEETVVREQASKSLILICEQLSEAEIHNVFAPLVIKLAQGEWFTKRLSSVPLFQVCYQKCTGPLKEKLRKKFVELCNEDTPMIRRACAQRLGIFSTKLDTLHVLQEILPIFRQLSQDEQDTIRVMCLESLIPMAKLLTKEENQIHTLGTLLGAAEDKSWKVRLSFAKNFAGFADSFGKEITDNNLIQTFILLLKDDEPEVKLAAINNTSDCLKNVSVDKINNLVFPTIQNSYSESSSQFKAGVGMVLCDIASYIGKSNTIEKIIPILEELIKDENSDVKLNVVNDIKKIANVVGDYLIGTQLLKDLVLITKENQWRLRMAVYEQIADLGIFFGRVTFIDHLQTHFMTYLNNTAASVRKIGVKKSAELAENFGQGWIRTEYLPLVIKSYNAENKGYNYRICCLSSLASVMPCTPKEMISDMIIPIVVLATKDKVPNVRFCAAKMISANRQYIDTNVFQNQLLTRLKEMSQDLDKDVSFFAQLALNNQPTNGTVGAS